MPTLSCGESEFQGNRVLEVLVDGQPWGAISPYDAHFRFGRTKARLIVAATSVIQEFVESSGALPRHSKPRWLREGDVLLQFSTHPYFNVNSIRIDQPYMKLVDGQIEFGFGLQKANALLTLMPTIEAFIRGVRLPPLVVASSELDLNSLGL
ncbi:MAG: hypothetical protein ACRENS_05900 [Candidatus Eiseniibacteriota bacterium]